MGSRTKLTAARCKAAPAGKHLDGGGLYLVKQASGAGQWIYRYALGARRREMGLGGFPNVSLAAAREQRDRWAAERAQGRDPLRLRDAERRARAARGPQPRRGHGARLRGPPRRAPR